MPPVAGFKRERHMPGVKSSVALTILMDYCSRKLLANISLSSTKSKEGCVDDVLALENVGMTCDGDMGHATEDYFSSLILS
jgi:hypothetical protein